jgi:uncharacterized protein (DUF1684 family)
MGNRLHATNDGLLATSEQHKWLDLIDWRRSIAALYDEVRNQPDPRHAHQLWRQGRDRLFRAHPQSPLTPDDQLREQGLPYWPYDPALRWTPPLEPVDEPRKLVLDTGTDGTTSFHQVGVIKLPSPFEAELAVWWLEGYAGGLFLPIRDATAGSTSYGGGRYLLDTAKGADLGGTGHSLVIDLNFLYHPSCRYNSDWACPLPPAQNTVTLAIEAGEALTPR